MLKQGLDVVIRACLAEAGLAEVKAPDVHGVPGPVVLDQNHRQAEPLGLVQGAEDLGPGQCHLVRPGRPALDLDEVEPALGVPALDVVADAPLG